MERSNSNGNETVAQLVRSINGASYVHLQLIKSEKLQHCRGSSEILRAVERERMPVVEIK